MAVIVAPVEPVAALAGPAYVVKVVAVVAPPESVAALAGPAWELQSLLSVAKMVATVAPLEAAVALAGAAGCPQAVAERTWLWRKYVWLADFPADQVYGTDRGSERRVGRVFSAALQCCQTPAPAPRSSPEQTAQD